MSAVGLSGKETVEVGGESLGLQDALMNRLACTVLSKIQIKKFNEFAQSDKLNDLLQIANKDALVDYMWGRELIDLFLEFPQSGMSAQDFVGLLAPDASPVVFDCLEHLGSSGGSPPDGCCGSL